MVGRQELVARLEGERAEDGVHARRGIRDEREVVGVGADEGGQLRAGAIEQPLQLPAEEPHRLALHPLAKPLLRLDDGARAGAERPVVEEGHAGVEGPEPCPAAGLLVPLPAGGHVGAHRGPGPRARQPAPLT